MKKNIFKGLFVASLCMTCSISYAARYYWVGGGSDNNWNTVGNWSTESGGLSNAPAAPANSTTVVFDGNSGLASNGTINIVGNVLCDSLIIEASVGTNAPVFDFGNSSSNSIRIYGSLLNHGGATVQNTDGIIISFLSAKASGESIFMNGLCYPAISPDNSYPYNRAIQFQTAGKWKLMDDMAVSAITVANNGTLDFDGYNVGALIINVTTGKVIITNSTINCNNWTCTNAAAGAVESTGSLIKIGSGSFTAPSAQEYNDVEFTATNGNHTLQAGTFNTVTVNALGSMLITRSGTSYSSTINNLIINTSAEVKFGRTTVNTLFRAISATCGGQVMLSSIEPTQTTRDFVDILKDATVDVQRAIIYNLGVRGGEDFRQLTAENSYDWGGNTGSIGFTGSPATGRSMYWIGGGGSWNDPAHWSLSNGGSSANCVPTLADNVFFTAASGNIDSSSEAGIKGEVGYCNNITVSGVAVPPVLTSNMIIGGSLAVQPTLISDANYTFVSDGSETVNFNNNTTSINGAYTFRSKSGTGNWTFSSNFNISGINLERGSLDMSGLNNIKIGTFNSDATNENVPAQGWLSKLPSRSYDISNSTISANVWRSTGGAIVSQGNTANSLMKNLNDGELLINNKGGDIVADSVFITNGTLNISNNITINKYLGTSDNCDASQTITAASPLTITMGTDLSKADRVKIYKTAINNVSIAPDGDYDVTNCTFTGTSNGWNNTEVECTTTNTPITEAADNGAQAFIYDNMLNVVSKDGSAIQAVMIYDVKGVMVYEKRNVNSIYWQTPATQASSQVLIVKVVTSNGAYVMKVINR
jgi:hypothetical protein